MICLPSLYALINVLGIGVAKLGVNTPLLYRSYYLP